MQRKLLVLATSVNWWFWQHEKNKLRGISTGGGVTYAVGNLENLAVNSFYKLEGDNSY